MKRTTFECDICGDDIVCMDGVLEIQAVRHREVGPYHSKERTRMHICSFCQEKIRSLVLADDKTANVADVMRTYKDMGGNEHAE